MLKVIEDFDVSNSIPKDNIPPKIIMDNADISPLFKKNVIGLLAFYPRSENYTRKLKIYNYFNNIFSKYLCGFRKGHSRQHCLLFMLENLRLDNRFKTGIFRMIYSLLNYMIMVLVDML